MTTIALSTAGAGTWTVPADWNNANNTIHCIGGGGGSGGAYNGSNSGGGGGGAYAGTPNVTLTPGNVIQLSVGAAGAGGSDTPGAGGKGGTTWFGGTSEATAIIKAVGGNGSTLSGNGASGGAASSCVGSVKRDGGGGGKASSGGGGGGAGGPYGAGNAGSGTVGGSGDAGYGGAMGSNGTEIGGVGSGGGGGVSATSPGLYGGAARGRSAGTGVGSQVSGRPGAQGVIIIVYTPLVAPTITSVSPSSGLLLGGDPVTITGTGFVNVTAVKFGGLDASDVTVVNNTTITCDTPAHTTGTVDVTVTNAAGTGTKSNGFTYNDTPAPAVAPFILGV